MTIEKQRIIERMQKGEVNNLPSKEEIIQAIQRSYLESKEFIVDE